MEDETKLLDTTLTENRRDTKLSVSSLAKVWENLDGIPGKKNVTIIRNGEKIRNGNEIPARSINLALFSFYTTDDLS